MSRSESSAGYMSVSSREADGGGHVGKASPPSSANSASLPQRGVMDVLVLIIMNVISSVAIVSVNKVLVVSYGFRFILLLSTTHFVSGWLFLHIASSPRFGLFERVSVPRPVVITIALAGMASILLMNYSLRANSIGSYQILKVAVLPTTMALSYFQRISTPSTQEIAAASLVIVGTAVCTVTDMSLSLGGLLIGVLAVLATSQYQIFQGTIQKQHNVTATQAMYLMSLPQAFFTLCASLVFETDWASRLGDAKPVDDLWRHEYSTQEVVVLLVTCGCAVFLNYSTIALIGKTSAVAIQFVNQLKTVLVVTAGVMFFGDAQNASPSRMFMLVAGMSIVFVGVGWYTKLRNK